MTTVKLEGFNLKYYFRLYPEMLPLVLFLGFVGWFCELMRKLTKNIREVER